MYGLLNAMAFFTEEGEAQEAPNPIVPDITEVIWGTLAFLILLFFMWKYAYPAVRTAMEARTAKIQGDIDAAEQARSEAEELKVSYAAELSQAKTEASRIIEEAREQAEVVRRERIAAIDGEIAERRAQADADIVAARERALAEVRGQVAEMAIGAAESVIEANLDREANTRLVESFIERVGAGS